MGEYGCIRNAISRRLKYVATPRDIHIYELMFSLSHILRKTVTKKNLATPSYMGVILHAIDQLIGEKPESGFIKHGVVYVKILDQGKKIKLFQEKPRFLKKIQETLDEY